MFDAKYVVGIKRDFEDVFLFAYRADDPRITGYIIKSLGTFTKIGARHLSRKFLKEYNIPTTDGYPEAIKPFWQKFFNF